MKLADAVVLCSHIFFNSDRADEGESNPKDLLRVIRGSVFLVFFPVI